MAESKKCSSCGAELPPDAPGGHCPQCLLKLAGLSAEQTAPVAATIRLDLAPEISTSEKAGDRIGHYKLLQQIGEGGMGTVWMAEQQEPVRRKVAFKVVKLGMDTRQVVARFEAERQALALMDHPNIAKVLDAGATDAGRPFFVMELVRGIKITDYCDQNNLSTKARLDLFIQVCHAIQHAHQKGIIHRDIKPSNILVTMNDGVPMPKVIDFGIAKATTDQQLTDKTLFTAFEQFIGTPAYMSPEQAEMTALDIDTRSDIYSLGVLLYELLTGKTPFEAKELLAAGLDAMRRMIREQEPPRPSTRLSTMQEGELTTTAKHRQADSPKLMHLIRGDLDWIVMKTLEKDRTRRYETANGLVMDIQRHLNNEPVTARPPGNLYRFQKMVRRNRLVFGATAAVSAALIIGLLVSTWSLFQETAAHQKEREARQRAVAAEKIAQAESMRAADAALDAKVTLANADFLQATRLIAEDNSSDALAYLARSLSGNPTNLAARCRLYSLLSSRSWMVPMLNLPHSNSVWSAEFSPDGDRVVTGSYDGTARVWDAKSGKPLTGPMQHQGIVWAAHFSSDGNRVVTGSNDGTARVWDAKSGLPVTPPMRLGGSVESAQFSPDGKWVVTASADKTARVWDAQTGQPVTGSLEHTDIVLSANFSPDSKRIATASWDKTASVWNAVTGQPLTKPMQHDALVNSAQFSPDGNRVLTCSWDGTARVWDAENGSLLMGPLLHAAGVLSAQFSPDGRRIITASYDRTAQIWDAQTGAPLLAKPLLHDGTVLTARFSPDGRRVLSASADNTARLWDASNGRRLAEPLKHTRLVNSAQFSPDGRRILTACDDNMARLWDALNGSPIALPLRHDSTLNSAKFSPDGRLIVTASADGTAHVWNSQSGQHIVDLVHDNAVNSAQFSPDGHRIVTASADNTARVWDGLNGWLAEATLKHNGPVNSAQFSPDGHRIVTASDDMTARVWNTENGVLLVGPLQHAAGVLSAQFSPDGRWIVTVAKDLTARVWDAETGKPQTDPLKPGRGVSSAHFSPDNRRIATTSSEYNARVWDSQTGRELTGPLQHGSFVTSAQFSSDGKRVVTASTDHTARVWDAETGQPLFGPLQHADTVTWAQFSPDGHWIVTTSEDKTARVWDAESGQPLTEPLSHSSQVAMAQFSPDNRRLITISGNTARIWDIAPLSVDHPDWEVQLAEVISGEVLGKRGLIEPTALNRAETINRIREQLNQAPGGDDLVVWGRWFLADPATRTISPFSTMPVPDYIKNRIKENTDESLDEVGRLAFGDTNLLRRISEASQTLEMKKLSSPPP